MPTGAPLNISEFIPNGATLRAELFAAFQVVNDYAATLSLDSGVVHDTGNETIAGVKTFSSSPIVPTLTPGDTTTKVASTAFVAAAVAALINAAPGALDTLDELAAAFGDDANFATTMTTALALKAPLSNPVFTGVVQLPQLYATGNSGFGTNTPNILGLSANYRVLSILGSATTGTSGTGILELASQLPDGADQEAGLLQFLATSNTTTLRKRVAYLWAYTEGATANDRGGRLVFATKSAGAGVLERMRLDSAGNFGIGVTAITARLHLPAGGTAASTAPLKFTSGSLLTTPEAGAVGYNNKFYLTESDAVRRAVVQAANSTKVTAGAPHASDGYVTLRIDGVDVRILTTA